MIESLVFVVITKFVVVVCATSFETRFDNTPLNVTVTVGKTAILPCRVTGGSEDLMILWMNPKKILISQRDVRYIDDPRMSIERPFPGDWNLHIRYVRYQDRGEYKCTINSDPIEIRRIRLTVQVPSHIDDKLSTKEIEAVEGDNVKLECNATGLPSPKITWFRKRDQDEKAQRLPHEGGVLMIYNITRHMGGTYECVAYNNVPPAVKRQIPVKVLYRPELKLTNRRLGQYRGKETILECKISASPLDQYSWKRYSYGHLDDTWKYRKETFQEDKNTITYALRIISVEAHDFGIYTCEASNSVGRSQANMELYEYFDPVKTTEPTTTTWETIGSKNKQGNTHKNKNNALSKRKKLSKYPLFNDTMNINKDSSTKGYQAIEPEHRPEKQRTGHVGTGYIYLNTAISADISATQVLLSTVFILFVG